MSLEFESDDVDAAENVRDHGAALAFRDPFAVEWIDPPGNKK